MNFEGFTPYPIERFSSVVEMDDPTNLPTGVLTLGRNVKFSLTRVRTRDGIQNQYGFSLPDQGSVTGLASLKVGGPAGDLQVPFAFSSLGNLYKEFPVGSGRCNKISDPNGLVTLPAGSMQVAPAYAKGFLTFGDLKNSLAAPAVYSPALDKLDPASMLPVGQPWQANRNYFKGECITPATPVGGNGRLYQCTTPGKSGAQQPNFSVSSSGTGGAGSANSAQALATSGVDGGGAHAWTNPGNVGSTSAYATVAIPAGAVSNSLLASIFGFAIPSNATITGIQLDGVADQFTVREPPPFVTVTPAGFAGMSKDFIPVFGTIGARFTLGGKTDLWGVAAVTPAQANAAGFGMSFVASSDGITNGSTIHLNDVQITIYYTLPAGGVPGPVAPILDNGVVWTDVTPTMVSSALAGNVAFGLRYMGVLFVNRNGYISGMTQASIVSATLNDSLHQITVTFPTGPANTVARILIFTPAGQLGALAGTGISSAGPYFWIDPNFPNGIFDLTTIAPGVTVADVVSGVTMHSTLINDNATTIATLNFTDDYLKATLNDVSDFFRKIQIPGCSDAYFSAVQKRVFWAADNLPSGWYVSLQDDPESVYGDTGFVQAAENNGENRTAVRDFNNVTYLMKEKSGYALAPTAGDPSTWDANPQWSGSGPCGPRAVDVATNFMCYVHRSGVWIFEGGQPYRISKELPITWSKINWAYQKTIWVMIDDETREIRIGVPYGQSTVPNIVLKCNYEELAAWSPPSFAPPIHFSPYVGKEIASGSCYKWSVDDISANVCIRAERVLPVPVNGWPIWFDLPTAQSQILYGSANPDGHVDPIIPFAFDDNGVGIDSQVETACPAIIDGDGKVLKSVFGQNRLGGVQLNIDGYGQGGVLVLALRGKDPKQGGPPLVGKSQKNVGAEKRLKKPWIAGVPYSCGGAMTNECMRIRVTNDKQVGVWFDLKKAVLYAQPVTTARPG